MKTTLTGLLFCLALWATLPEAQGQIRDDNASMAYLAIHCGASAGKSASSYEEYGAKLARTIGDLDVVQQERVFGYVPRPSGGSGSTSGGSTLPAQTVESLADSMLASQANAGSHAETSQPAETNSAGSPLLEVSLSAQGSTDDGASLEAAASVGSSLLSSDAEINLGTSLPLSESDGSTKEADGGGTDGTQMDPEGAPREMPQGYENLPDWLSKVIEQFESKFLE